MEELRIHPTAVIHPEAQLADSVTVGPYSVVGPNAKIADGVRIASHCVIEGWTTIGKNCQIFTGAVVGSVPQDKKHKLEDEVYLHIGENNIIREYVTMNPGTIEGGRKTIVGNNNLFMAYSHVAHDCVVGNQCVLANSATLAGHVTLEENVIIGGLTAIHQFVRLGRLCIIGGCSKVVQDIPPFSMCDGHPAKVYGLNLVGLRRAKVSASTVSLLKNAFKILFNSGLTKGHALEKLAQEIEPCPEIEHLIFFVKTTERGLCS